MQILISPAAVALRRIIGTDDVLVLVIDVFLLVPVSVFVVVGGRGIYHTGGGLPVFVTVGQAEKLVERAERPHSLHVLQPESFMVGRRSGEPDQTTQAAARFVYRRSSVQQRGIIDKVRRDGGKICHAQHRVVDAHTIPRHLSMRGRGTPESYSR